MLKGIFVANGWYPQANAYQNAAMVNAYVTQFGGTPDAVNAPQAYLFQWQKGSLTLVYPDAEVIANPESPKSPW